MLTLTGFIWIIIAKAYMYFILDGIAYFIVDFIFPVYFISIDKDFIIIKQLYLGGVVVPKTIIPMAKIIEFVDIDVGLMYPFSSDDNILSPVTGNKKYMMHRIEYRVNEEVKMVKVSLSKQETEIIQQYLPVLFSISQQNRPSSGTFAAYFYNR